MANLQLIRSQNHGMFEAGWDFWRASGSNLLLKQGPLETVAQDHVQMAVEYVHGWRLHNLSGQPVRGQNS